MSSPIDQQEKIDYSEWKSNMSAHSEGSCLKKAETSTCHSSEIHFNSSEVNSEPRDEGECGNEYSLTNPVMQAAMSRQLANDIGRLEDETSDSTLLLGAHCNRSNGESCFENESVFQADDIIQSCVEDAATRHENAKGNFYQRFDNYGKDSQNVAKNLKVELQPQPETLLRPPSLPSVSSRSRPSTRDDFGIDAPPCFVNPTNTKKQSSSTVQHIGTEPGADIPSSYHSTKPTGTKKHFSSTAQYGGSESGSVIPSRDRSIKPIEPKEHSSPTAQHIRAELGADPIVRFIKPTAAGQHPNPASERGRENRDIFETGGELSRYPSAGVSFAGGEEIERLSLGESPEPQILISPTSSDEPSVNCCELGIVFWCRWFVLLKQRTARQFSKYPFFYLFSTIIIMTSVITWDKVQTDRDVPATIFISFMTFIAITLIVDRGQFSHVFRGSKTFIRECRRGCGRADPCIPLCCCQSSEPHLERHSQYRHLEEDGAFKHEIADVSKLDPKDCPQMKMVELRESDHADSPDFIPEVSQVNADVHVEKRDGEKLGASRRHLAKGTHARTTRPHKTRSDKARPESTKIFRADVHASDRVTFMPPEQVLIPHCGMRNGEEQQPEDHDESGTTESGTTSRIPDYDLGESDLSRATTSDSPRFSGEYYKKFSDCSPSLPRFASDIRQSGDLSDYSRSEDGGRSTSPEDQSFPVDEAEVQSDVGAFVCEHYGQSVACSCATLLEKRVKYI